VAEVKLQDQLDHAISFMLGLRAFEIFLAKRAGKYNQKIVLVFK